MTASYGTETVVVIVMGRSGPLPVLAIVVLGIVDRGRVERTHKPSLRCVQIGLPVERFISFDRDAG